MAPVHEIILSVSRLEQVVNGDVVGYATGFFYGSSEQLYLVTNRHVVKNNVDNISLDKLRLYLHTDIGDTTKNRVYEIDIFSPSHRPLWKEHPFFKEADLAVIKINMEEIKNNFYINAHSPANFLPEHLFALNPGEDVFVMGYPYGYYDRTNNLPIFKNAMIASCYGINFENGPYFLIDSDLKEGMSGSPVLTKPYNIRADKYGRAKVTQGTPYYILGVHSSKRILEIDGKEIEPGLHVVWYIQLVEDIINEFK